VGEAAGTHQLIEECYGERSEAALLPQHPATARPAAHPSAQ
jgi:hypothetical protein